MFLKSTSFAKLVPLQKDEHCAEFFTPLSQKNVSRNFFYLAWFVFSTQLSFEARKNIPPLSLTAYKFWMKAKNEIQTQFCCQIMWQHCCQI